MVVLLLLITITVLPEGKKDYNNIPLRQYPHRKSKGVSNKNAYKLARESDKTGTFSLAGRFEQMNFRQKEPYGWTSSEHKFNNNKTPLCKRWKLFPEFVTSTFGTLNTGFASLNKSF